MEKLFKLKENGTDVKTEIIAGLTTFLAMAYILIVNPSMLATAGMDQNAVLLATAISAAIATLCMAFFANYPVALASGMGLNAYFTYTVCLGMGVSWKVALTAILVEGLIFIVLSLFKFRETLVNSIPANLKFGITAGIGLFISIVGLKGAGVSEMMQAIFGAMPIRLGTVYVNGEPLRHGGIHNAMCHRIGMIPANRKENSVIPDFTLLENNYISEHTLSANHQLIRGRKEVAQYNRMRDMLNIKANSHDDLILSLSGGNQQKVILGRWLTTEADILIMDNPTQGIDVGAKAEIYKLILELAEKGKTILVNTLEIPEIQKIADRCVVFYHGHIQTILPREEITEERVMLYATNVIHATEGEVNV